MMADRALPIIFLNLSGEMLYVIQQRLEAQNVSEDKSNKVIQDILTTMLNDQFIEELFKPQHMYSRSAMQSVFEKLVHSSIMRLNTTSMSKLYDLMLMVFKYQVLNCQYVEDLLLITLNHMDAIKDCAAPFQELHNKVENVFFSLIANYKDMRHLDCEHLFDCIMAFLQDLNIRVSVLMRLGLQLTTGEIVRSDSKINLDRTAFLLQNEEECLQKGEEEQEKWRQTLPETCFDFEGNRGTSLGTNIYIKSAVMFPNADKEKDSDKKHEDCNDNIKFNALEEVTLLNRLIGNSSQSEFVPDLLFASNEEESIECQKNTTEKNCCFVTIDALQKGKTELGQISKDFFLEEENKEKKDILELLDFAENEAV